MLHSPVRLIDKDAVLSFCEDIQQRYGLIIKIIYIAVVVYTSDIMDQGILKLSQTDLKSCSFFRLHGIHEFLYGSFHLFLDGSITVTLFLAVKYQLPGRKNRDLIKFLYGALAVHVKAADGFYLIAPQFYSVWNSPRSIKNIYDTSAYRKLTRHLHCSAGPCISHLRKQDFSRPLFKKATLAYLQYMFFDYV